MLKARIPAQIFGNKKGPMWDLIEEMVRVIYLLNAKKICIPAARLVMNPKKIIPMVPSLWPVTTNDTVMVI